MNMELRRHNGQNPYGDWLKEGQYDDIHGAIPSGPYSEAINEALETGTKEGHIVADNGQHYDWRLE